MSFYDAAGWDINRDSKLAAQTTRLPQERMSGEHSHRNPGNNNAFFARVGSPLKQSNAREFRLEFAKILSDKVKRKHSPSYDKTTRPYLKPSAKTQFQLPREVQPFPNKS